MVRWDTDLSETGNQARVVKIINGNSTSVLYPDKSVALIAFETDKSSTDVSMYTDYTGYSIHYGNTEYNEIKGINVLATDTISYPTVKGVVDITNNSFKIQWYGMSNYHVLIDVSISPVFSTYVLQNQQVNTGTIEYIVSSLNPNTTYYYRLRHKSWWNDYSIYTKTYSVITSP